MSYFRLLKNLYSLRRNIRKTPEQMKAYQEQRLRSMLVYAYQHSAYYHRTFEGAGITEETIGTVPLSEFPAIDKAELLEHFDELVTVSDVTQEEIRRFDAAEKIDQKLLKGKYHVVHSSGSTGKPGYFIYDDRAWSSMLAGIIRGALWDMSVWQMIKLIRRKPRIVYIAATDGRYGGAMAVGDGVNGIGGSSLYLDINTPLTEWIQRLKEFKPDVVIGYPSAIKILAGLVERRDIEIKVIRVISCGEPLGGSLRSYLEHIFHTQVVNIYGASESLALGVETVTEKGMFLFDDMNVIEMHKGSMYLTSLYNFAQPLIRYRISDQLTLRKPDGKIPYPFTRAEGLLGREEDILWFEDGEGKREFLHPLAIEGFCIEGLLDYQFRQITRDTFEMYAQISENASKDAIRREMQKQMQEILNEKGLGYVQFYVDFVEEIRPDPETGKKSLILPPAEEGETVR